MRRNTAVGFYYFFMLPIGRFIADSKDILKREKSPVVIVFPGDSSGGGGNCAPLLKSSDGLSNYDAAIHRGARTSRETRNVITD